MIVPPSLRTHVACIALAWCACLAVSAQDTAANRSAEMPSDPAVPLSGETQLFENEIRPVLAGVCFRCHGDPKTKLAGGLRLDSREALIAGGESGAAIVPGQPKESLLVQAISRDGRASPMPPENEKALRPEQIRAFERWIALGAPWPTAAPKFESHAHWAFQPLQSPSPFGPLPGADPPAVIDALLRSRQDAAGVRPASIADKRTLLRRASFDLTGLPPSIEEIEAFENDSSPDAWSRTIDRLLASPHYGEHWARHWLDVVRYADTAGETADYPVPTAWRYRNYVIDAFNADISYDQFLREQIAGDVLAGHGPEDAYAQQVIATGFLAISRRFGFDSENYQHLTIQDTIDTLGQSVLGLSLGCARCHDHKFDPISMQDYYGLYGIFDSSRYAFPGSEQKQKVRSLMALVSPERALAQWRQFDREISVLRQWLERNQQPVTPAILRYLGDMDGDFELQAPAAGGSYGVLVPPWMAEGNIAVTNSAQSPFRNVYAGGKVGAHIQPLRPGDRGYRMAQALYPRYSTADASELNFSFDFRMAQADEANTGEHEIWLGQYPDTKTLGLRLSRSSAYLSIDSSGPASASTTSANTDASNTANADTVLKSSVPSGAVDLRVGEVVPGQWMNVQLRIDLRKGTVTATLYQDGCAPQSLESGFNERSSDAIDLVVIRNAAPAAASPREGHVSVSYPGIEIDNLAVLPSAPPPPVSQEGATHSPALADQRHQDVKQLQSELADIVGADSGFEFQTEGAPPTLPWNAGPNSVVKIARRAASPSLAADGGMLGVHLPNRAEYDGFGIALPSKWKAETTEFLSACFDFRCADATAGGDGTWRYYVGHGPGHSAAVELYWNRNKFFSRSADARPAVADLQVGTWYRVQLTLDLRQRRYSGTLSSIAEAAPGDHVPRSIAIGGQFAPGWDGVIDHSFIDSYGHLAGVRPALDVDNYRVDGASQTAADGHRETEPAVAGSTNVKAIEGSATQDALAGRRARADQLKAAIEQHNRQLVQAAGELARRLADGPFEMAYAMAEGTPHDVPIQLRGEPSQAGPVVPRGFIKILGQSELPAQTTGSGRLQLANWLTTQCSPLVARVMVNRIWQYHFGRGIVSTPNDFGARGQAPSHPELLDYLASQFIASGWSVKAMHRAIMLSESYQRSSQVQAAPDTAGAAPRAKPADELFASFSRRRLSAEEIRDTILAVSGGLDKQPGREHPFSAPTGWGYTQHAPFSAVYDHPKRSIYLMVQRLKRHPFLALFDGADPNASTAQRLGTTVPTQALYFLNDPFVHSAADRWAEYLIHQVNQESDRIEKAIEVAYSRPARQEELNAAAEFLARYRAELQSAQVADPTRPAVQPSGPTHPSVEKSAASLNDDVEKKCLSAWLRILISSNEFIHID